LEKYWHNRFDRLATENIPDWQKASWWYEYIIENQKRFIESGLRKYSAGKKLLIADIGCGPGINIEQLTKLRHRIMGLDFSINELRSVKTRGHYADCQLIGGDASLLPLKPNIFDAALFLGVMQTADDPERQIHQLAGVLKPGGMLLLSALRQHSLWELPFWPIYILSRQGYYPWLASRNTGIIKSRKYLLPRPGDDQNQRLRRYPQGNIKSWLANAGFHKISFKYDGPVEYIPHLSNSIMIYVSAFKK